MVMKKALGLGIGLILMVALTLTPALAETLRLAHHHAVGGTVDLTAKKFAELVQDKSKGALTVRIFPAAQLGQEFEAFDQLNQGILDMTITSIGAMERFYPAVNVTSLPFIFRSWDHAEHAFKGEFGKELAKGIRENSKAEMVGVVMFGFRDMLFRGDPVTSVEAIKGMKMRSPEAQVWIRMFQLLDARPTPVTWGEVYTAMQTGVAQGLESPPQAALDMKFNEVTKSLVRTQHMFATMGININEDRMAKLSPANQAIIREAGVEAADWSNSTISRPGEQKAYGIMRSKGMKVVEPQNPAEWAERMKPLWKEVSTKAKGADHLIELLVNTK